MPGGGASYSQDALRAVFLETSAHMRNAEQKQLTVTSAFLTLLGVVLSLVVGGKLSLFKPRIESTGTALLLLTFGSGVLVYQRWCRVWKEQYLKVLYNIAESWTLPHGFLPVWLKTPPQISRGNVDNALFYLTRALNVLLLAIVAWHIVDGLKPLPAYVLTALLGAGYVAFLVWVQHLTAERA